MKETFMKILKLSEFDQRLGFMMAAYGKPSTGKTTFAGTWPKRTLFIHTGELGLGVIKGIEDIDVVDCPNVTTAQTVFAEVGQSQIIRNQYKSVVVDSLHCLRDVKIREYVGEVDWAKVTQFVLAQVNQLIPLMSHGIDILLISHESLVKVEGMKKKFLSIPSMGERTSQAIIGKCDVVGYFAIEETRTFNMADNTTTSENDFVCYLRPHPEYYTRVRKRESADVPEKISNPTYEKIRDIFRPTTAAKPQPAPKVAMPPKAKPPKRKPKGAKHATV